MGQFTGLESLESRQFLSVTPMLAHDTGAADSNVSFTLSTSANQPQPTEGGVRLTEHTGQRFTAKLGEFHLKVIDLALNATVDWGDAKHSHGKIEGSYATGDWYVEGTHRYDHTGTFKVTVKIFTHPIASPPLATSPVQQFTSVIKVKRLAPTEGGRTLTETAGQKFNDKLGEFTFRSVDLALTALINWGDGTHSDGKLVGSYATGEYYVFGKHTYAHTGTYSVDVKIFAHLIGSPIHPTEPVAKFTSVIKVKS